MPIVKLFPSVITPLNAWTNPNNAKLDDGVYATTTGTENVNHRLTASGFIHNIPTGSTINSVTAEVQYKLSTMSSTWKGTLQVNKNGVEVGLQTSTAEPTTDTIWQKTSYSAWTYGDLTNASVAFTAERKLSTSCTYYVDYLALVVDYTPPSIDYTGTVASTDGYQQTLDGSKSGTTSLSLSDGFDQTLSYTADISVIERYGIVTITNGTTQSVDSTKSGRSPPVSDQMGTQEALAGNKSIVAAIISTNGSQDALTGAKSVTVAATSTNGLQQAMAGTKSGAGSLSVSDGFNQTLDYINSTGIISRFGSVAITNGTTQSMTSVKNGRSPPVTDQMGIQESLTSKKAAKGITEDTHGLQEDLSGNKAAEGTTSFTNGLQLVLSYSKAANGILTSTNGFQLTLVVAKNFRAATTTVEVSAGTHQALTGKKTVRSTAAITSGGQQTLDSHKGSYRLVNATNGTRQVIASTKSTAGAFTESLGVQATVLYYPGEVYADHRIIKLTGYRNATHQESVSTSQAIQLNGYSGTTHAVEGKRSQIITLTGTKNKVHKEVVTID